MIFLCGITYTALQPRNSSLTHKSEIATKAKRNLILLSIALHKYELSLKNVSLWCTIVVKEYGFLTKLLGEF